MRVRKPVITIFCRVRSKLVSEFPDVTESEVWEVIARIQKEYTTETKKFTS